MIADGQIKVTVMQTLGWVEKKNVHARKWFWLFILEK